MEKRKIKFSTPDITTDDLDNVVQVIKSGWLAHGKYSEELETLFCSYTRAKYSTTVSNCTAGLHLSCLAAGFKMGDEVIVPAQTHTATSHAAEYTGAKAIFADVDPITGNILVSEIEKKINSKTKGIIPVHMAGYPCEMKEIVEICNKNKLTLIEDCAHGIGTNFMNKHVGNFGIAGCFSFYPTKQITTGEGGIVVSNDKIFIDKVKKFKAFGIDTPPELRKKPGVYDVQGLGYNYRMTDFQAALGAGQMKRYEKNVLRRRMNAKQLCNSLIDLDEINFTSYTDSNSYFLFQIIVDDKIDRDKVLYMLQDHDIGISIHYATPVPLMSYYKNKYGFKIGDFPNAEKYANQTISLPIHPKLSEVDMDYIAFTIKKIIKDLTNES